MFKNPNALLLTLIYVHLFLFIVPGLVYLAFDIIQNQMRSQHVMIRHLKPKIKPKNRYSEQHAA